ncbi:MAG TPA: YcnI family protein [Dongiaceae bacterium]|nr:YcnI family protein [Dongiaceae bacterium]
MTHFRLAACAAACLILFPVAALAHVTLETGEAPADGYYKAVLRVPHGCEGAPTTAIRVQIPAGVKQAKPMPKPGWQLAVKKEKLAQPYDWYGTQVTEDVREISWSGGNLPDAFYDEFVFRAKLPDAAGQVIRFPVIQTCATGEAKWIEIPAAGAAEDSVEHPAPSLKLGPKAANDD